MLIIRLLLKVKNVDNVANDFYKWIVVNRKKRTYEFLK